MAVCRKAWRREAMDLLLDPAFFQMDHETLRSVTIILRIKIWKQANPDSDGRKKSKFLNVVVSPVTKKQACRNKHCSRGNVSSRLV
jgi:hypothetical protein